MDLTVPIIVLGHAIGEFEVSVEITVTSFGYPGSYWYPPEGPEWEAAGDISFYGERDEDGKRKEHELPAELEKFVDDYLATAAAAEAIAEHIAELELCDEPDCAA